ncbi:helix-turn-helix domain-containing protein [Micromonospora echinospora]
MAERPPSFAALLGALVERTNPATSRNYTPADVAAGTGLSKQAVSLLLTGSTANPSRETIQKLAEFFGVDPGYFFTGQLAAPRLARRAVSGQGTASPEMARRMDEFARKLDELQTLLGEMKADAGNDE